MRTKRTYNRDHCCSKVRATITDTLGRTITLMGKHAFEWQIVMECNGKVIIQQFHDGATARKEFNRYTKKR